MKQKDKVSVLRKMEETVIVKLGDDSTYSQRNRQQLAGRMRGSSDNDKKGEKCQALRS